MSFKLVITKYECPHIEAMPDDVDNWPYELKNIIPDINVKVCKSRNDALKEIVDADAVYGEVEKELFEKAASLKWICCSQAGPKAGYYYPELIQSNVTITNTRGIFNDHISAHIMSFILLFARGLHYYLPNQLKSVWDPNFGISTYLPEATVIIVGLGGIGARTGYLCSQFGLKVIGVDPRVSKAPEGINTICSDDELDAVLSQGDFVVSTVPETPKTQKLFSLGKFKLMKPSAYFINIGRGATVSLDDLHIALESKEIAGAALDVFEQEPLPNNHPLWKQKGMIITPHVAADGPFLDQRRKDLLFDNCLNFSKKTKLNNIVDKNQWF